MNYMLGNNEEESSSGCESGWTLYLQHSSLICGDASYDREHDSPDSHSHSHSRGNRVFTKRSKDDDQEDEDMSMVSDASSGPPHLHEDESYNINIDQKNSCSFCPYAIAIDEPSSSSRNNNNNNKKKKKNRENPSRNKVQQQHSSLLDDTASSPFLNLCNKTRSQTSVDNNVLEYSQGYSTTQFEVRPQYQEEHYDFFQSGNHLQQNHSWFDGKRW